MHHNIFHIPDDLFSNNYYKFSHRLHVLSALHMVYLYVIFYMKMKVFHKEKWIGDTSFSCNILKRKSIMKTWLTYSYFIPGSCPVVLKSRRFSLTNIVNLYQAIPISTFKLYITNFTDLTPWEFNKEVLMSMF